MSNSLITLLREKLPKICPGKQVDELSDGILCWRTILNLRTRKLPPTDCFIRYNKRNLAIVRDKFLDWYEKYLDGVQEPQNNNASVDVISSVDDILNNLPPTGMDKITGESRAA